MKVITLFLASLISLATISDPLCACTIFKATKDGFTLVGNNEDWNDPDTKVWFLMPEEGVYGRVYFGFKNGWAQGGMNDQGLFFDWVAGFESDYKEDPKKKNFKGSLSELILEKAATVEEALAVYSVYNERAFTKARIFLADRTGASAVVGFSKGKMMIDRREKGFQVLGAGYKTAASALKDSDAVSVETFCDLLKSTMQHFKYPTQYSNVYDLQKRVVYLCNFRHNKAVLKFSLDEELKKGNHYYDIPKIEEQLKAPLQVDGKTLPVVHVRPSLLERLVGTYRIKPDLTFTVSVKDGALYGQVQGNTPLRYRPASETKFFLPFWDQQISFTVDAEGTATAIKITSFDGADTGEKIDP
jgi:hypothetical protein